MGQEQSGYYNVTATLLFGAAVGRATTLNRHTTAESARGGSIEHHPEGDRLGQFVAAIAGRFVRLFSRGSGGRSRRSISVGRC
jgi:hypothetical protein